ncbi:MAG: hypothetical protein ABJZ55_10250 [Fuerstiella sp.]
MLDEWHNVLRNPIVAGDMIYNFEPDHNSGSRFCYLADLMHNTGSYTLIVKKSGMSPLVKRPMKDCPFAALEMHDDLVRLNPDAEVVLACLMNGKIEAECAGTIRAIRDAPA